jgi:metal-responsive CopG/Arc/MetJ family transcriptional regulator
VPEINVTIDDQLAAELASVAEHAERSQDEMVVEAIKLLVQAHRGLAIPRYARRLGPLAFPEDTPH